MQINEILTEASIGDALAAIAKDPRILANPGNIEAAANRLRSNRDVANFTQQMLKVWNNLVDQERKKNQSQAQGFDGGRMPIEDYENLLKKFISQTILGTPTNRGVDMIIQDVVKAAEAGDKNAFKTNWEELVSNALMIKSMTADTTQQQDNTIDSSTPPPRSVDQVKDALRGARISDAQINQLKAAIASMGIKDAVRTNDRTIRALLTTLGIPVS